MTEREIGAVLGQLAAIRAMVDSTISLIQGSAPAGCPHDDVANETSMGDEHDTYRCKDCGAVSTNRAFIGAE